MRVEECPQFMFVDVFGQVADVEVGVVIVMELLELGVEGLASKA